jgi:uncharacterized membrane protein YhaH (DUF805 family)
MWVLTSFQGRIRRSHYWLAHLSLSIVSGALMFLPSVIMTGLGLSPAAPGAADWPRLLFGLVLMLALLAADFFLIRASIAVTVKRWHDRGKTGWLYLVGLIPIIGLWPFIELGFLDGTPGENAYGPSPKGPSVAEVFS